MTDAIERLRAASERLSLIKAREYLLHVPNETKSVAIQVADLRALLDAYDALAKNMETIMGAYKERLKFYEELEDEYAELETVAKGLAEALAEIETRAGMAQHGDGTLSVEAEAYMLRDIMRDFEAWSRAALAAWKEVRGGN